VDIERLTAGRHRFSDYDYDYDYDYDNDNDKDNDKDNDCARCSTCF